MAAAPPQQFCVRWNSYHANLQTWFPRLLSSEQFADVTLACESRQLRCHKIVLSACSAYLERLLASNPCKHPIVLMRDMRFSEMQALVDFMYKGEVNVTQEELPSLLKSAEALQIRGLCSSENGGLPETRTDRDSKDFSVASDALLANAQRDTQTNGPPHQKLPSPPPKKPSKEEVNVKEETVEEDGLYYGELDADNMEYNEDEEPGKPGSSIAQTSDFAISNVQCQYDSGSESDVGEPREEPSEDHTYGARSFEPPAFLIRQTNQVQVEPIQSLDFPDLRPKMMTIGPMCPSVNVIHVGDQPNPITLTQAQPEYSINKRIRRSEVVLRQAADCVSRGHTFQTVSEQFNIPISTIRFFMARKGILPRRRRGRTTQVPLEVQPSISPEPPLYMQHFKLPSTIGIKADEEEANT